MPLHGTVVCYARAFFRQTSAWLSTWIQSLLHQCASLSGRPLFSCSGVYRPVCPSTYPSTTSDEIERRVGRQRSSCLCISPLLSYSGLFICLLVSSSRRSLLSELYLLSVCASVNQFSSTCLLGTLSKSVSVPTVPLSMHLLPIYPIY